MTRDHQGSAPAEGRDPVDTPLITVLRRYEDDGYTAQFASRDGGTIHCFSSDQENAPERCRHGELRRLEGASDPADMLVIVPLRCPTCEARGVLVANYGPEATAADAEVLQALERVADRGEAGG